MTIRKISKDRLPLRRAELSLVESRDFLHQTDISLRFWTKHETKPCLVDLIDFESGRLQPKQRNGRWSGAFNGRPALIHELLPAIKEKLMWATEKTCNHFIAHLRSWWRLLDEVEVPNHNAALAPTRSVKDLTRLHHQIAVQRFGPNTFSAFTSVAEITRRALGMQPLAWSGPEPKSPSRDIPKPDQSRVLFTHIKRGWFEVVDRWKLVDEMLTKTHVPQNEEQRKRLLNAEFMHSFIVAEENFLDSNSLKNMWTEKTGKSAKGMWRDRLSVDEMFACFFPDDFDIRLGFHLALIGGGWNVQTLLDLSVNASAPMADSMPFLRNHPQDSSRYIMTGFKERGGSYHPLHGDWKSDRSPGQIVRTIVQRTWPLRQEVVRLLRRAEEELSALVSAKADIPLITKTRLDVIELQRKSRSVWLYHTRSGIQALSARNFSQFKDKKSFLPAVIADINKHRAPSEEPIPHINASDFRDIFAEFVYRISGGSVLAVQKALGHNGFTSTARYLDNKIINTESARTFVTYTNEMWAMCVTSDRIDHTVLRQMVERTHITSEQKMRLDDYRNLKKSRLGVGCIDPTRPPPRLAPQVKPDGSAFCTVHRCTLCFENAVIAPEALEGLAMRLAELLYIKNRTPIEHFHRGGDVSWQTELQNTETALLGFDAATVQSTLNKWMQLIEEGKHRAPEFNGISERVL